MNARTFPAKILLYGEYVVLDGGVALAVPLPSKSCYWSKRTEPDDRLIDYALHLTKLQDTLAFEMSGEELVADVKAGWQLSSTIPVGYGAGSSGAVVAAIYDRYVTEKAEDITVLQTHLARLESFFHGTSSGVDALVSWTGRPVLSVPDHLSQPILSLDLLKYFALVDTGFTRSTRPLVEAYKQQLLTDSSFRSSMQQLRTLQDKAVLHALDDNIEMLFPITQHISRMQLQHMANFIPQAYRDWWAQQLSTNAIAPKLAGAGGGGYLLVMTKNKKVPIAVPSKENIVRLN